MNINFDNISQQREQELRNNTLNNIYLLRKKEKRNAIKKQLFLGVAASLVFLISIGLFNYFDSSNSTTLDNYVKTNSSGAYLKSNKIELTLSDSQKLKLEDSITIAYNSSGSSLKLLAKKEVSEIKTEDKILFNTLTVPFGKRAELQLADGSKVWLNAGSKLIYPNKFRGNLREVFLEGEAIFDIEHKENQPFLVKTKDCRVEVLGTLFNVRAYPEDKTVETTLARGKVRISHLKKRLFRSKKIQKDLIPGNKAIYLKGSDTIKVKPAEVANIMAWQKGYVNFKSKPLEEILDKLSRYYNIKFYKSGKINKNVKYSGSFYLNDNILHVAKTLTTITDHYCYLDSENKTIIIE
ncbi:FecR family protein [Zunongwangia sp.]|uniref:FecR family protein n=1 Tax=Zunongwangia sp. TaxID=1965325 RepID=UPI003AA85E77